MIISLDLTEIIKVADKETAKFINLFKASYLLHSNPTFFELPP